MPVSPHDPPAEGCRKAVEAERAACRKIAEDHLRLLLEERHLDPASVVEAIIRQIDARAHPGPGSG